MKSKPHPSQEQLHELFDYREDNISQPLVWKIRPSNSVKIGDVAGSFKIRGYFEIIVGKNSYKLHRFIWIYHYGDIPSGMLVDHIDGNKVNNCIENLRLATPTENLQNSKIRSNNSGIKGVWWYKSRNRWRARIRICGKEFHVGYFHTKEEAEAAVIAAREKHHGEFARHE